MLEIVHQPECNRYAGEYRLLEGVCHMEFEDMDMQREPVGRIDNSIEETGGALMSTVQVNDNTK